MLPGKAILILLSAMILLIACDEPEKASEIPDASYPGKIAFLSDRHGDQHLFLMNGDGTDPVNLTQQLGDYVSAPSFSPDGTKLVFTIRNESTWNIGLIDLNSDEVLNLTNDILTNSSRYPWFSADGSKIYFSSSLATGYAKLFQINVDGSALEVVADSVSNFILDTPRLRFMSLDHPGLSIRNLDGSQRSVLSQEWVYSAQFSPDGSEILLDIRPDVGHQLYRLSLNENSDPQLLLSGFANYIEYQYSPDGSKIIYVAEDVFSMNADGSEKTRLVQLNGFEWSPMYSPDGSMILFSGSIFHGSDYAKDIYLMNDDGSGCVNLTNSRSFDILPLFQPVP